MPKLVLTLVLVTVEVPPADGPGPQSRQPGGLDLGQVGEKARCLPEQRRSLRPVYPDRLTRREVEVLRLLGAGKSSRENGEELVLSVRTVERHIANVYAKIGAHGRAEAAVYAARHGLA